MDNHKLSSEEPALEDLYPMYLKQKPECPAGGKYTIGTVDADPICSIGGKHSLDWR